MLTTSTLLAAGEQPRGWGGTIALAAAVLAYLLIIHSPTLARGAVSGVKSLVRGDADTADTAPDTASDTGRDTDYEWGRITHDTDVDTADTGPDTAPRRGRLARLTHILRTGSSLPQAPERSDGDVIEPTEIIVPEPRQETLEEFVLRVDCDTPYMEMVREIQRRYGGSEATAKRRIRQARAARR